MKYSAENFSYAGDKYIGRLYSEMDCQKFVENMMRDIGLNMDLGGSNAWYREVMKNGWVGSPEECLSKFGKIPKGAFLFIHAFDGGEEKRGYHDGLGNASHIGVKTGRTGSAMCAATGRTDMNFGDGAIHSSYTRDHVSTSKFKDRTINGGWNKVGLYKKFTYGDAIDQILDGGVSPDPDPGPEPTPPGPEPTPTPTPTPTEPIKAVVDTGGNGKLLTHPSKGSTALSKAGRLDEGTPVEIIKQSGDWARIKVVDKNNATWYCWVKSKFLRVEETPVTITDEQDPLYDPDFPEEGSDEDFSENDTYTGECIPEDEEMVSITFTLPASEWSYALPVLEELVEAIARKVGRG